MYGPCFVVLYLVCFLFCNQFTVDERELVALLLLPLMSCKCKNSVSVSCGDVLFLQYVIVAFPGHTHLLFGKDVDH